MTIRNLEYLFKPRSVALIGASETPGSVGAVLAANLFEGGFQGPVLPVNPKHERIGGREAYRSVASLPMTADLAVISTPPEAVPDLIAELGARGTRAAVVITAGFGESKNERGRVLHQALLDAAKPHLLRVIGPNCLGVLVPGIGLNASFAHLHPKRGALAFAAQSGAIVTSIVDWAEGRGIGFSHLVSLGDMADVDFSDMLDYLANDPETHAILLYIEAVTHARKFMSAARAAARMKPCIVVKAGRHAEGARAAASHTGALAGLDAVYDAAFRRAGMLRVYSLDQLFDAAEILAASKAPTGARLAILTNGGGIGVLATDHLMDEGGELADLAPETLAKLNAVLPPTWSQGNPMDIIGDAPGHRYAAALGPLLEDLGVDAILVLNCPTAIASGTEAAEAIVQTLAGKAAPVILTSWVGDKAAAPARQIFIRHGIPTFDTPGQAVRAFMYRIRHARNLDLLMQTPPSVPEAFSADIRQARAPIERALSEDRAWLTEPEAKEVLLAYGIPAVATRIARTPHEAAAIAAEIGAPVALKILSPAITHKSDIGGVALGLLGPGAVRDAATGMLERVQEARPEARLEGFSIEPMVHRPGSYELILGVLADEQFGPVILCGHGGMAVEVIDDKALGLPPLNMHLAHEILSRTRIYRQLLGFRGQPRANIEAIALTLIKLAQIVIDIAEIVELDINPLLTDAYGVVALDARIKVAKTAKAASERLAIRPYPKELEEEIVASDGRSFFLRPILPEDEPMLQACVGCLTPEEARLRFFIPMKTLSHMMAARFTQIDYDREMALVLTERGIPGKTPIYGVVQIYADPDLERAEYAILVRHDMARKGLGTLLMRHIIDYARSRGIGEIGGDVLCENTGMLKICRALGFSRSSLPGERGILRVTLKL